jgi:hypothetical protein
MEFTSLIEDVFVILDQEPSLIEDITMIYLLELQKQLVENYWNLTEHCMDMYAHTFITGWYMPYFIMGDPAFSDLAKFSTNGILCNNK